jgi:catechol 2,3-dioxygenase-like lactoylglutathione lyase family enzyme
VLTRLASAVVAVEELRAAAERTAQLLGRPPVWIGAGAGGAVFQLANAELELLPPDREGAGPVAAGVRDRIERGGEGLHALVFATDDADACAAELRARGLQVSGPREVEDAGAGGERRRWRDLALVAAQTRHIPLFVREELGGSPALPAAGPPGAALALDHVVVTSSALESARRLYGDLLGLRLALDRSFPERGIRILFFRPGGPTLEVAGPLAGAEGDARDAPDRFGGLAWRVAELGAARERLLREGFPVSQERRGAKRGTRVCTVRSGTCGVPTLLIAPEPESRGGPGLVR